MTDHCRRMLGLTVDAEPTIGALLAKVHNEDRDTLQRQIEQSARWGRPFDTECRIVLPDGHIRRSEEHTSELQSLMRISYAVFCLQKKKAQTEAMNKRKL